MKKYLVLLLVCAMLFAFGCGQEKNEEAVTAPAPESTPESTPAVQQQEAEQPAQEEEISQQEQQEDVYVYTSTIYGFTVTMPASWQECCIIEEDDMQVRFYSAANRYMEYDGETYDCGNIFTVMMPEDSMKDGDGYLFPSYDIIGQSEGADILVVYPSDVQIADFEDEDAVAEYTRMNEEKAAVIESIAFG